MQHPLGYSVGLSQQVCLLHKNIYGLKQVSCQWYSEFSTALLDYGFIQSKADYSLFTLNTTDTFTALLVYVDDIIIAGPRLSSIEALQHFLADRFKLKSLRALKYFLGIDVGRYSRGIQLSQRKYTLDILAEAGSLGTRPLKLPMDQNLSLHQKVGSPLPDVAPYCRLVGRLLYLTITRPDISFTCKNLANSCLLLLIYIYVLLIMSYAT